MVEHVQIPERKPVTSLVGDGVQTRFEFTFPIFKDGDVRVLVGGILQTSGYVVSGAGQTNGGFVTFSKPPESGQSVVLYRQLRLERISDLLADTVIRAKVINDEFDYQVALIQQIDEAVGRSLKMAITTDGEVNVVLPPAKGGAVLGWSGDGTSLVNDPPGFVETLAAVASERSKTEQAAADTKAVADRVDTLANSSADNADLAQRWASNPMNSLVADGLYSARHYAEKAREVSAITLATEDSIGIVRIGAGLRVTNQGVVSVPNASTSMAGIVQLATSAEVQAGTDAVKAVTPAAMTAFTTPATTTRKGMIQLATAAEAQAGTDAEKAVTPSGVRSAFNAAGPAPVYACRAWVNFNGTGTVAIRGSGNVSSITDNGVGDYTVNFITPMPDANYSALAIGRNPVALGTINTGYAAYVSLSTYSDPTLSSVRLNVCSGIASSNSGNVLIPSDQNQVHVCVFR